MRRHYTLYAVTIQNGQPVFTKKWSLEAYSLVEAEISFKDNDRMPFIKGVQYLIMSD